jgi:hypothetical protein
MEAHQNVFWSEWKIKVEIPYEDILDNVTLSQGVLEIRTTKVSR